jgi:hypothetical protein
MGGDKWQMGRDEAETNGVEEIMMHSSIGVRYGG